MDVLAIPGLREAIERETEKREFDFLGAPELLCGIEVMPLSIRRLLRLQAVNSPFLYNADLHVEPSDVAMFFWSLSPNYERALAVRQSCELVSFRLGSFAFGHIRRRFARQLRQLKLGESSSACRQFVADAFEDSPGSNGVDGPTYYGWPAGYVGLLATEYGWTEDVILDLPLRRLWQHVRRLIRRNDPSATLFNPSDKVRGEWLREQNRN